MKLKYVLDRWGKKVRVSIDDLESDKRIIPMYNQYGNKVKFTKQNQSTVINRANITTNIYKGGGEFNEFNSN